MNKKEQLEPEDKKQSVRFIKTAEELLADDAEARFEEAIRKILPPKQSVPKEDKKSKSEYKNVVSSSTDYPVKSPVYYSTAL